MNTLFSLMILAALFSVSSSHAAALKCPKTYRPLISCTNLHVALAGYDNLPQLPTETLILCGRQERPKYALVTDKSVGEDLATTVYAEGDGFGRNGFEVFTDKNQKAAALLLPHGDDVKYRVLINNMADQGAATGGSDFTCAK